MSETEVPFESRIRIVLFGVVALIAGIIIAEMLDGVKTALLVVSILFAGVVAVAVWGDDSADSAVKSSLHAAAIVAFVSVSVALYFLTGFLLNLLGAVFAEWGALFRIVMWAVLVVVVLVLVIAYSYYFSKSKRDKVGNTAE